MEDKLIVAVCGYPELYDTSSYLYRDRTKKDLAWRHVSEDIGQPDEICRKKWKTLRDTYMRKRREETERKSGSGAGPSKKWKYSAVMSFLNPFVTPRESTGNMGRVEGDSTAEYFPDAGPDQDEMSEAAAGPSELDRRDETDWSEEEPEGAAAVPAPPPAATPAPAPPMGKKRARKRQTGIEKQREVEKRLLQALEKDTPAPPAPPLSEDELFMRSLVPSLARLPPQQKEYVKFKIHKLIYEASTVVLNLESLE